LADLLIVSTTVTVDSSAENMNNTTLEIHNVLRNKDRTETVALAVECPDQAGELERSKVIPVCCSSS
jgi:hypothetical protein